MNIKKLFIALSLSSILFFSCESLKISVPGETDAINNDLYNQYLEIADSYFNLEKYDKALVYYKKAIENPNNYWAIYYKIAYTYALMQNWKEAEAYYQVLLERDKDNSSLKASMAFIYANNNKLTEALNIYDELITQYPEVSEYFENKISIVLLQENYELAEKLVEELKEKFSESKKIDSFTTVINNKKQSENQENNSENQTASENTKTTKKKN